MKQILVFLGVLGLSTTVYSQHEASTWTCRATDAQHREWSVTSTYQLTAMKRAEEACKKQSQVPLSCEALKSSCEGVVEDHEPLLKEEKHPTHATRPQAKERKIIGIRSGRGKNLWQCMALDGGTSHWVNKPQRNALQAAFAALRACRQNSALPDTCYVYVFACRQRDAD